MKRVASLCLPSLPTDRLRRIDGTARRGKSPDPAPPDPAPPDPAPLVTQHRSGQRIAIAAACPLARALGLYPAMAITQARALVPGLDIRPAEPEADAALLTGLALFAARRWTPRAAVCGTDGLWLDSAGVAHLFGGERAMCERILRFCSRLGFDARIAAAGTTGAAHALARFGEDRISLCGNGDETAAIAPLPLAALRLDDAALSAARRFGIENVGELMGMPRGPLARRFGKDLLVRIDQALGRAGEPFDPVVPEAPPRATLRLLEPIASAEAIGQVLADLIATLAARLQRLGIAARRLVLVCERVDGREQRLAIGTARASRDPKHLLHLLGMKVEAIEPGFGIEAMHLVAERCEPLPAQQIGSGVAGGTPASDLPQLIDRIVGRIGSPRVFRCGAVESDVPERSVRRGAPLDPIAEWPRLWPRPVRLLARPEPVDQVIAELPDQPPLRFSWRGQMHRVRKADGPERIYGEWWKRTAEAAAVRDYFQVEDDHGARFWLFRSGDGVDRRTGDLSWYMHGVFA